MSPYDDPGAYGDIQPMREPPHNIHAEQVVLGSLLTDNSSWDRIAGALDAGDFFRREHRDLFASIAGLAARDDPFDFVTVAEHLDRAGRLDDIGGLPYIGTLITETTTSANIVTWARIVRDAATRRALIAAGAAAEDAGHSRDGSDAQTLLGAAQEALAAIAERSAPKGCGWVSAKTSARAAVEGIDARFTAGTGMVGVSTGWADLDESTRGLEPGSLIVVAGRPSMGKALSVESKLLTSSGWLRMGDVRIGDRVIGRDGKEYPITGVFPQGEIPLFRVSFDDGAEVLCCDDHLWLTCSRGDRKAGRPQGKVRALRDIRETLRAGGTEQRLSHQVPWAEPMDLCCADPVAPRVLAPYLLGLWLGDGSIGGNQVRFHNPEADLIESFARMLPEGDALSGDGKEWTVKRTVFNGQRSESSVAIESLGLLGSRSETKFVPNQYLWASSADRESLLRGLLDADGYCYGAGVEYTTASPALAEAVRFLVRSLGGRVTTVIHPTKFDYLGEKRTGLPSHRMVISFDSDFVPVSSEKHLAVFKGVSRRTGRYIESVEPAGSGEAQCITVGSPDSLFITDDFIVTHNTAFSMQLAGHVATRGTGTVAVFSLEMPSVQLSDRQLAGLGRVPLDHIRTGKLTDDEWPRLASAASQIAGMDMEIDDASGLSAGDIVTRARKLKRERGNLALVVIDYLQRLKPGKAENQNLAISDIVRQMKDLAKGLNCPVVLLSQLNRNLEHRPNKRPIMSDLRESGSIEQDADLIIFLYRDEVYNENTEAKGIAEAIIEKQRNGPLGTTRLHFDGKFCWFNDLAPEWRQADSEDWHHD